MDDTSPDELESDTVLEALWEAFDIENDGVKEVKIDLWELEYVLVHTKESSVSMEFIDDVRDDLPECFEVRDVEVGEYYDRVDEETKDGIYLLLEWSEDDDNHIPLK